MFNSHFVTTIHSHRGSHDEDHKFDDPNDICDVENIYASHYVACKGVICKPVSSIHVCLSILIDSSHVTQVNCDVILYERVKRGGGDVTQANNTAYCDTVCPDESYSRTEYFNAIFGIIAFITIALLAAVYGTSWAMWTMDPGEDSIVYQMTAPRVKTE